MSSGTNVFGMITSLGDAFSKSYEGARKEALASDLGEKIRTGDYAGAADVVLKGGDIQTGLALVKMGEGRGASRQLAEGLGGLFGGSAGTGADGGPVPGTLGALTAPRGSVSGPVSAFKTDDPVADGLTPQQKALLNGIAGPESAGKYNVRFTPRGGALFDGYAQHPGIAEMGPAGPSTAAGRYQFTKTTWDGMGGGDFSPANQDRRALQLAMQDYQARTGRDLEADLRTEGFSPRIQKALAPTWTGLAGNQERNAATYAESLARYQGQGGSPTQVASADPDAANKPAIGARQAVFAVPPGSASGQEGPTLGQPAPHNTGPATPGQPSTGLAPGAGGAAAPAAPAQGYGIGNMPVSLQLAGAGVPRQAAVSIGRAAPGSPERIQGLIRLSLIPGLSEQQSGLVKTLLTNELDQTRSLTTDQKEYAQALTQGFQGTLQDWKGAQKPDRVRFVQGRDGQQYAVDPNNLDAAPRSLNLPGGVRVWGRPGPDGQIVQPPPNVPASTAGYYDADGTPQLITGKGVSVTTNVGSGETEEAKEAGKLRGKRVEAIEAAAMKAPDQIARLNLLQGVLDKATTGALGPTESKVVGFAKAVGIPSDTIGRLGLNPDQDVSQQVATKIINEAVTGMIGSGGFPSNNFSNSDREFLTDIFPKMSNRAEANRMAIEVLRRVQQRNLEFGDAWQEYQQAQQEAGKPVRVAEFEFNFRKGLRGKPDLFADLRQEVDALPRGGTGDGGGDGAGTPPPKFSPSTSKITMTDAQALKAADDTPENRQIFDARYGEGAAQFVLRRPAPPGVQQASAGADTATGAPPPASGQGRGQAPPPSVSGARQAPNGNWYVPDPSRPGKYLQVQP